MAEKKFDQFGRDVQSTLQEEKEMEFVTIGITRKELNQLYIERHERWSKPELSRQGQFMMAVAHIQGAVALLKVTSKEKAKEAMADSIGDFAYMEGRSAAEVRGNPKDLESYEKYMHSSFEQAPFIPHFELLEETDTYKIEGVHICPWAESIRKMAEMFPDYVTQDVIELAASLSIDRNSGRAWGFNPDRGFERVGFLLDDMIGNPPSKGCYFKTMKDTD